MYKKIFWLVSILALIYVLLLDKEIELPVLSERSPASSSDEDYIPSTNSVYQFKVDHCTQSVSSVKEIKGSELYSVISEMKSVRSSKGTSIENKNNVFYPVNNCISLFISNSLMEAERFRKSIK